MRTNKDKEAVYSLNIVGNAVRYHQFFYYVKERFERYQVNTK